jgi:ribosome-associated heat shock protein Hsp15
MSAPSSDPAGGARLDSWLFAVRLMPSRSVATQAVGGGRVHLNGGRVKPSHALRPGDQVSFKRGALEFECTVRAIPARRGPAREATLCYTETEASAARRAARSAERAAAGAARPDPGGRPDKHARVLLRRLKGRI